MNKTTMTLAVSATLLLLSTPSAHAVTPSRGCPNGHYTETRYPLGWSTGDPIDPVGENRMIQAGIAGFEEVFGTLQAAMTALGFADFDAFYEAVADPNFRAADRNGDGTLCFKPAPAQSSTPPYYFNVLDNGSNARG